MLKKALLLFLLLSISTGCSERLLMLKRLGASQKEMQKYVTRQERGFLRLRQDIERNRLQKGIPKKIVTKKYGEPIFCDPAESGTSHSGGTPADQIRRGAEPHPIRPGATAESGTSHSGGTPAADSEIAQSCLYRSPTEHFSTDKVYLYFDRQESLHSWKFEPADS